MSCNNFYRRDSWEEKRSAYVYSSLESVVLYPSGERRSFCVPGWYRIQAGDGLPRCFGGVDAIEDYVVGWVSTYGVALSVDATVVAATSAVRWWKSCKHSKKELEIVRLGLGFGVRWRRRGRDDSGVATSVSHGVASLSSWANSICDPETGITIIRGPQKLLPPFKNIWTPWTAAAKPAAPISYKWKAIGF